jgi:hypothetical protein
MAALKVCRYVARTCENENEAAKAPARSPTEASIALWCFTSDARCAYRWPEASCSLFDGGISGAAATEGAATLKRTGAGASLLGWCGTLALAAEAGGAEGCMGRPR